MKPSCFSIAAKILLFPPFYGEKVFHVHVYCFNILNLFIVIFFSEEKESLETRKGSPLPPISKSPPPSKGVLPNVPITLIMGEYH